jgi:hypothetical protein
VPSITIDVPPEQRDDLLYELLSLYGVKAEAIYHAANNYLTDEEPLHSLLRHRAEMTAVDTLIEQLGWQLRTSPGPARITGEPQLLADISHAALANAVEDLGTTLSHPRFEADHIEAIVDGLRRITGLFELVAAAYQRPSAAQH